MNTIKALVRVLLISASMAMATNVYAAQASCPSLLNHRLSSLQEQPVNLCDYQGRVILLVNTASFCGNTPQYAGLEKLYAQLEPRGLTVIGFPANDFGAQEPGSNQEIAEFCKLTYNVK
jgi:glutathione peroxidase